MEPKKTKPPAGRKPPRARARSGSASRTKRSTYFVEGGKPSVAGMPSTWLIMRPKSIPIGGGQFVQGREVVVVLFESRRVAVAIAAFLNRTR